MQFAATVTANSEEPKRPVIQARFNPQRTQNSIYDHRPGSKKVIYKCAVSECVRNQFLLRFKIVSESLGFKAPRSP